jgi:hypothetical protein
MIAHLLSTVPYREVEHSEIEMPKRPPPQGYLRPAKDTQTWVPDHAATLLEQSRQGDGSQSAQPKAQPPGDSMIGRLEGRLGPEAPHATSRSTAAGPVRVRRAGTKVLPDGGLQAPAVRLHPKAPALKGPDRAL